MCFKPRWGNSKTFCLESKSSWKRKSAWKFCLLDFEMKLFKKTLLLSQNKILRILKEDYTRFSSNDDFFYSIQY